MNAGSSNMKGNGGCGCGCACGGQCGCDSQCCELECLVRPNFFCGQMLTDADLAAMVEWTRSRLALARYRDGWGIACGLELSCSAPGDAASCCGDKAAESGPVVYLNAGYALDCCGNDLVVCAPIKVDLGPVCRPPDDPCDPRPKTARVPQAETGPREDGGAQADCLQIKAGDLVVVKLSLRYHEDVAQGQRAMFRGACSDDGPCQYARVLERPCVFLEESALHDDGSATGGWRTDFEQRLRREAAAIGAAVNSGMDAILQYIRHNPPYQFCFLEEAVCCLRKNPTQDKQAALRDLLRIGKLLFVDWLLRQLQCPCSSCLPDDGVPLGRVLLRRSVVAGRTQCSVVSIEQNAQHRRPLRKDPCRELGADELDLSSYLWRSPDDVQERLESQLPNMQFKLVEPSAAGDNERQELLDGFTKAVVTIDPKSTGTLHVHVVDDIVGTPRIAFFVME